MVKEENEPNYGDSQSEEIRRDSYNADHNLFGNDENEYDYIIAKKGFHGIINHPTNFLTGEAGRERVNITPLKKRKKSKSKDDFYGQSLSGFLKGYDF
jgi:hypothetical protein